METKYTLSDTLARLSIDIANMNEFLYSLEKMLESKSENVTISQKLDDGSTVDINVPSFGYLKSKIDDINSRLETLLSTNSNVVGVKSANGDVRKFELKKFSQLVQELEGISDTALTVPTEFRIKNNFFFESLLNPLLYVNIDITGILTEDIDQFSVKRIIINSTNDDDLEFFDANYLGNNEINLDSLKLDLENNGIDYFEDDNIVDLPVAVNRYKGSFDVIKILEEEIEQTGVDITVQRRRYKLSTLNYTDILDGVSNTRILAEGDTLITDNDSEYVVKSVNKTDNEVVLERIFGIEPITIGADILRVKPLPYRTPELQVNVGYNEREVIFIRPISKANNLTVDDYSNGFGVFTNDLKITLEDDSEATLEEYYNNFVADFGLILLNAAKERKLPAVVAETPDVPVLTASNFQVVQVDRHIQEDEDTLQIQSQISEKENLKTKIKENNKKIDELKAQLNDTQKTSSEKSRIEKKIQSAVQEKSTLQSQLSSTVKNLNLGLSTTPSFIRTPKYQVRGFWPMPEAKSSRYGKQEVVQFVVRYRYLSKKGTAPNAQQSELVENGVKKFAVFSPWEEVKTKSRKKVLDESTGLYVWKVEDVSNAEEVNINQIGISIRKGETVEIQVKSLSEAGWPDNPAESDWSESVQVQFPEEIESTEEATLVSQKSFAEEARLDFEDELTARGLDLHLLNQFTTGERFFAHKAQDIASGFYVEGTNTIIDLYEQLLTYKNQIESLQQAISTAAGVIKVKIIDGDGNTTEVKNGDTVSLFAGYYKDLIKDTSGGAVVYNEGKVITKQYVISIENTSATQLELISLLQGGVDQIVPVSDPIAYPDSDYHINRRYDLAAIAVNNITEGDIAGFKHIPSVQSAQVKSQFFYSRERDYGLSNDLYLEYPSSGYSAVAAYNYQGILISGKRVPLDWGHYLPFSPTYNGGGAFSTNPFVWNGTTDASSVPQGGGYLSEFCIHQDHPELDTLGVSYNISSGTNQRDLFAPKFKETVSPPAIDSDAKQVYLKFAHSQFFETSVNENTGVLGNSYYVQALRETPLTIANNNLRQNDNYPIKLGFTPNDEYLIGKYTCGSYLYVYPNTYQSISVDGNHPLLSAKKVQTGSENSINIPVLFQFRCSDKLGYVGGYRTDAQLNNIKYSKKIGIDIFVKNDVPFSFDIEVNTQYKKETTLDSPLVPSRGAVSISF